MAPGAVLFLQIQRHPGALCVVSDIFSVSLSGCYLAAASTFPRKKGFFLSLREWVPVLADVLPDWRKRLYCRGKDCRIHDSAHRKHRNRAAAVSSDCRQPDGVSSPKNPAGAAPIISGDPTPESHDTDSGGQQNADHPVYFPDEFRPAIVVFCPGKVEDHRLPVPDHLMDYIPGRIYDCLYRFPNRIGFLTLLDLWKRDGSTTC